MILRILQFLLAIPLVLFGRVEDPFVSGMAEGAEEDGDFL